MLLYFFTLLQALQEELETRSNQVRSAEKKLQHKELEAQEQVRPLRLLCSVLLQPSGCFTLAARILLFWEQSAPLGHQKQGRALPHRRGGLEIVRHWSCISDVLVALPPLVASSSKQCQDGYSTATYPTCICALWVPRAVSFQPLLRMRNSRLTPLPDDDGDAQERGGDKESEK